MLWLFVCFFKQKTAYEVRISEWSSDVCSSDLFLAVAGLAAVFAAVAPFLAADCFEADFAGPLRVGAFLAGAVAPLPVPVPVSQPLTSAMSCSAFAPALAMTELDAWSIVRRPLVSCAQVRWSTSSGSTMEQAPSTALPAPPLRAA